MFQVFFFDRKQKHEYYKPNNSAAAVTYKKNWIGKKTNKQTKNILKKRNETKRVFLRRDGQRKQTNDKFGNVSGHANVQSLLVLSIN